MNKLHVAEKVLTLIVVFTLVGAVFLPGPSRYATAVAAATGATITVNSVADSLANDGKCTLREAVIAANKNARSGSKANECPAGRGADLILLPGGLGVLALTRTDQGKEDSSSTGDLDVTGDVVIQGTGPGAAAAGVTIGGPAGDRIFHILSGSVTLQNVTLRGGIVNVSGGVIYNAATLTLDAVTVTGGVAEDGAGIANAPGANLILRNSTVSGNLARRDGGGLHNLGSVFLNNVTVTANTADSDANGSGEAGGLRAAAGGTVRLQNTLLAGNLDASPQSPNPGPQPADCFGDLVSLGYNLIGDPTGCVLTGNGPGDLLGQPPLLGPLQDNGGPTLTHALLAGSPALNAGNPLTAGSGGSACEPVDQRGVSRPRGAACDIGAYEALAPNAAVLIRASAATAGLTVVGRLAGAPQTSTTVQFYTNPDPAAVCTSPASGAPLGAPQAITTGAKGNAVFRLTLPGSAPLGHYLTAVVTDPAGIASSPSACVRVGLGNDSWPHARPFTLSGLSDETAQVEDVLDVPGGSRWFKLRVKPDSRLQVTLTGLSANYDLTLYKDINAAYSTLLTPTDLLRLGAEFAPDAFTPDAFTADVFSPDAFTPDAFTPDAFTPDAFTPDAFTPDAFTPDAFTPDAFTPDAFTPDAFTPDAFTPDAFTPDAFTTDAYYPDAFTPDAFTSSQTRSLIAISAYEGTMSEGIRINTWDQQGDFYIRVRGRNGAFDPAAAFDLQVRLISNACAGVSDTILPPTSLTGIAGNYHTLVLMNPIWQEGGLDEKSRLLGQLQAFIARPEVSGALVDVGQDRRVAAALSLSNSHPACPAAANRAAEAIKAVLDRYWAVNPTLEYVVLVGGDHAIPFFRHADHSMLASEKNFFPPVLDNTLSQSSLRQGYVLSQDDYGAGQSFSWREDRFPLPGLAIGRLVETASDASAVLEAYLGLPGAVAPTPTAALVTAYDFLEDAGLAVQGELEAGLGAGGSVDALITARDISPTDIRSWTASDLRTRLFGPGRLDLVFLAGHFSAGSALAADYRTRLLASELATSSVDLRNSLVYSAGCHAGYNVVNPDAIGGLSPDPDWPQAFARKGAALIAGTGYQYGDTDFIKYSEQLYLEFTRALRTGQGPVPVGKALAAAKSAYLRTNPWLRGIDEKAVLEATLFGLPMLSFDLPGERITPPPAGPGIPALQGYGTNPGAILGLQRADLSVTPALSQHTVALTDVTTDPATIVSATYYSGADGVLAKPNEPVLPLQQFNVSSAGTVLRGVGFRGAVYTDAPGTIPLTGAAATEIRGVHAPFEAGVFYPVRPWTVNYLDALAGGETYLAVTPVQFQSSAPGAIDGTLRRWDQADFRLFYSANIASYSGSIPALSAAPAIAMVDSSVSGMVATVRVRVAGNPAAGVQEVWITYTGTRGDLAGRWASLDLTQDPADSTLWTGTLTASAQAGATMPDQMRFLVQAVNGVGLVSMDTNVGRYYTPGAQATALQPASLVFAPDLPTSGRYSTPVSLSAQLSGGSGPLAGRPVFFRLGPQSRLAVTNDQGIATASLSIFGLPDAGGLSNEVRASFPGDGTYGPAAASAPFSILRQGTALTLSPTDASVRVGVTEVMTATLTDGNGRRLAEETVFFVLAGPAGSYKAAAITDYAGRAILRELPLPRGVYGLQAYFSGDIPPLGLNLQDERYESSVALGTVTILNEPPVCSAAAPSSVTLWPPSGAFAPVSISDVIDPEGDPLAITITGVFQDEPVGPAPDAILRGGSVDLRAERDGNGNGRVYHIFFTVNDGQGGTCQGQVLTGVVPHDQGGNLGPVDGGPLYDSTVAGN